MRLTALLSLISDHQTGGHELFLMTERQEISRCKKQPRTVYYVSQQRITAALHTNTYTVWVI